MIRRNAPPPTRTEWPTVALLVICHLAWAATLWAADGALALAVPMLAVVLTLHGSLTHEVLHGHPFPNARLNPLTVALPLGLVVPYARFRDLHLAHHQDARLTDPYDDPESNYLDPLVWAALPVAAQLVYRINNTLLGRMCLGPALSTAAFLAKDLAAIRLGDWAVARVWGLHLGMSAGVLWIVSLSPMPVWAYLLAVYLSMGILRIRTFAEHRAHVRSRARTVIIEDRGPLAVLFLFNSLHVVHHMHPRVPWYRLPRLYAARRDYYRASNDNYVFRSYFDLLRAHLLTAKDPVPHPLWRRG